MLPRLYMGLAVFHLTVLTLMQFFFLTAKGTDASHLLRPRIRKSFILKIIIQFTMEFKWVAYGLITLILLRGFSSLYLAVRMWREPIE